MLHDKARMKPSLEGFLAFVKAKRVIEGDDNGYCWSFASNCAVGQYLESRGWDIRHNWYNKRNGLLEQMDSLARGSSDGMLRDANGRFVRISSLWTWRQLADRIEAALVCS